MTNPLRANAFMEEKILEEGMAPEEEAMNDGLHSQIIKSNSQKAH